MRAHRLLLLLLPACSAGGPLQLRASMSEPLPTAAAPDPVQQLQALARRAIDDTLAALDNGGASPSKRDGGSCTRDSISIRKEW